VRTIPQVQIFSEFKQKIFCILSLSIEKLMPKFKHVGNAGGTLIVARSKHLMIISFPSMRWLLNLSMNVFSVTKKEIKAAPPIIKIKYIVSVLKLVANSFFGNNIERIILPLRVLNPRRKAMHFNFD